MSRGFVKKSHFFLLHVFFGLVWLAVMKRKMDVHFSSATNEWATPPVLYGWLDSRFHFSLDPCCTHETAKCVKHYTIKENGLSKSWRDETVFMNPPYGREIGKWVEKAWRESKDGATVVCLIPARTDTKWWYKYCTKAAEIIFLVGRVKFYQNGVKLKASAPFPSAVVVFKDTQFIGAPKCVWTKLSS